MVLGYNHNIMYKGKVFHIQTEDSGVANPHIITLLYREGVILCSKKTSYADIIKIENLELLVEELMKEQHKDMMRRLKSGEFDDRAFFESTVPSLAPPSEIEAPEQSRQDQPPTVADLFSGSALSGTSSPKQDVSLLFQLPDKQPAVPPPTSPDQSKNVLSLDDAILGFFGAGEK